MRDETVTQKMRLFFKRLGELRATGMAEWEAVAKAEHEAYVLYGDPNVPPPRGILRSPGSEAA